jgi:hypothetical protein
VREPDVPRMILAGHVPMVGRRAPLRSSPLGPPAAFGLEKDRGHEHLWLVLARGLLSAVAVRGRTATC